MANGIEYHIIKGSIRNQLLICSCDWYEDGSAFASGDNDYANYSLETIIMKEHIEQFQKSLVGEKWKNCAVTKSKYLVEKLEQQLPNFMSQIYTQEI
ncbi:MAG: hypothetical protein AAFS12_09640 [Cyanobacteria bacterium J06632_19]